MSARAGRLFGANQDGATAVELAICLPLLAGLLLGLFQFGWAQHCSSSMRFALQDAARDLQMNPNLSQSAIQSQVRAKLTGVADPTVAVTLQIVTQSGVRIARLTGVYTASVGVPELATFPIRSTATVSTALP